MGNWWSLKITSGPDAGKTFLLKRDRTVIGRVKGDVVLRQDLEASSVHAEITFDAAKGVLVLADLQSRNGSKVNGEKVEKRALMPGDKLKFGITEMVLEPPSAEDTIVSSMDGESTKTSAEDKPKEPSAESAAKAPAPEAKAEKAAPAADSAAKSAAPEKKEQAAPSEKKERSSDYRPSSSGSSGPEFYGFIGRFFGVLFHPTRFFDFLASENALISGDQALKSAVQFGVITWVLGGVLTGVLSYFLLFVWKVIPEGTDNGMNPVAVGIVTILGALLLPVLAMIYHGVCLAIGGKGPYKVALRVFCYLTAVHFTKGMVSLVPKVGPFLGMALECYLFYLMALAATRLYYVTTAAAYVSCALSVGIAMTVMVTSRNSAMRLGDEIAKLNPLLNKSIGVTFVPASKSATTATPPAQPVQAQTPPPTPAPEPKPEASQATATAPDAEKSAATTDDATTPATTTPTDQQRDPAAADGATSGSGDSSGDPQPPKFPTSQ